jgi:hypothetical protein
MKREKTKKKETLKKKKKNKKQFVKLQLVITFLGARFWLVFAVEKW